jgi:hypothetical protein
MDTVQDTMNNNINILSRINYLEEQIALRETIPYSERTEKQLIKLDNLLYELKQLSNMQFNQI